MCVCVYVGVCMVCAEPRSAAGRYSDAKQRHSPNAPRFTEKTKFTPSFNVTLKAIGESICSSTARFIWMDNETVLTYSEHVAMDMTRAGMEPATLVDCGERMFQCVSTRCAKKGRVTYQCCN